MPMNWSSEEGELYSAEMRLGSAGIVHAVVESLGETGWDWHVWDTAGGLQTYYGLADTLDDAQGKVERALIRMRCQLDHAA